MGSHHEKGSLSRRHCPIQHGNLHRLVRNQHLAVNSNHPMSVRGASSYEFSQTRLEPRLNRATRACQISPIIINQAASKDRQQLSIRPSLYGLWRYLLTYERICHLALIIRQCAPSKKRGTSIAKYAEIEASWQVTRISWSSHPGRFGQFLYVVQQRLGRWSRKLQTITRTGISTALSLFA
jgi:hypothetical protein